MNIRHAEYKDLDAVTALEALCFPPAEAASREQFADRLSAFPECFWLLEDNGVLLGMIDAMRSDDPLIRDEQFADASLHQPNGSRLMIMGVAVRPEHRRKGLGSLLLNTAAAECRTLGLAQCVLTCKKEKLPFYSGCGYQKIGVSQSAHGGAVWYDMVLSLT